MFFIIWRTISNVEFRFSMLEIALRTIKNIFYHSKNNFQCWISFVKVENCSLNIKKYFLSSEEQFPTLNFVFQCFKLFFEQLRTFFIIGRTISNIEKRNSTLEIVLQMIKKHFSTFKEPFSTFKNEI